MADQNAHTHIVGSGAVLSMVDPINKTAPAPVARNREIIRLEIPLGSLFSENPQTASALRPESRSAFADILSATQLELSARESTGLEASISNPIGRVEISHDRIRANLNLSPLNVTYDDQNRLMLLHYDSREKAREPFAGITSQLLGPDDVQAALKYDVEDGRITDFGLRLDRPDKAIKYGIKYSDNSDAELVHGSRESKLMTLNLVRPNGSLLLHMLPSGEVRGLDASFKIGDSAAFQTGTFFTPESVGQACGIQYSSPLGQVNFDLKCEKIENTDALNFGGFLYFDLRR